MVDVKEKVKVEEKKAKSSIKQEVVSMRQLLECGVHFGHQTKRWDPRMKQYIFTSRNGIHVIDLQQTIQLIHTAYEFIKRISQNNGSILFVGTKKQAQDAIKEEAQRSSSPYVNKRWLGGTLTNISTIRQRINKLKDYEKMMNNGEYDLLPSKEQSKATKTYTKLVANLEGIKDMIMIPSALFVVDTHKEQLAIKEAKKLGIPIIGIVDTNANPLEIDYPIPANDDAIRAIKLLCSIVSNAVIDGKESPIEAAVKEIQKSAAKKAAPAAKAAPVKKAAPAAKAAPAKKAAPAAKKTEAKVEKETTEKKAAPKKVAAKKAEVKEEKETTEKKAAPKKAAAKKAAPAKKAASAKKEEK